MEIVQDRYDRGKVYDLIRHLNTIVICNAIGGNPEIAATKKTEAEPTIADIKARNIARLGRIGGTNDKGTGPDTERRTRRIENPSDLDGAADFGEEISSHSD
jgi:hypothetical protein